jgi:hypothetical protein
MREQKEEIEFQNKQKKKEKAELLGMSVARSTF